MTMDAGQITAWSMMIGALGTFATSMVFLWRATKKVNGLPGRLEKEVTRRRHMERDLYVMTDALRYLVIVSPESSTKAAILEDIERRRERLLELAD